MDILRTDGNGGAVAGVLQNGKGGKGNAQHYLAIAHWLIP